MEYSMREFKKHTKRPSKILAMNSAAKVAGKQNLELCRNQSQAPRVRGELVDKSYYFCFYHPNDYGFIIKKLHVPEVAIALPYMELLSEIS